MYLAHGAASYIVNEAVQKKRISKLNDHEQLIVAILSILFGIFPDIDLVILPLISTPSFTHHSTFTHGILFFLSLWLLLNILFFVLKKMLNKKGRKILNDELLNVIQYSFIISTLSHLFLDILFSHSAIFFPLKKQITILGNVIKTNYFAQYVFTPPFACEVIIILFFLLILYKKYIKRRKIATNILRLLITISCIYLPFTIYMNLNTYNYSSHFKNGERIYDADYDKIQDSRDADTDNDGIDNIQEGDKKKIAQFAKRISANKYFASNKQQNIWENVKYNSGAFNSYRIISQAYFEQNLAIEPVLKEYEQKKYNTNSYIQYTPSPILLYEYFADNSSLYNPNAQVESGSIFFILNNSKMVNMGVVLDSETFVTVLDTDKRVVTHTKNDIQEAYPNCVIKAVNSYY